MANALPDWNDLQYFLAVARTGGLSHAAKYLHVAAATVGRRIDTLEAALQQSLFIRHQTGYTLTDAGLRLRASAEAVETAVNALQRQHLDAADPADWQGQISIACSEMVASYWIVPHLPAWQRQYPGMRIDLRVSVWPADLSRRDADVAVRFAPPNADEEGDYISQPLGAMALDAYASPALAAQTGDWLQAPYISWDSDSARLPLARKLEETFTPREPWLRSNCYATHYQAARAGVGVALLPCRLADADPELVHVAALKLAMNRPIWLLHHRDLRGSQRIAALRTFMTGVFAQTA